MRDLTRSKISLAIDSYLPEIVRGLEVSRALVIKAAPGTGKTTRVPLALMENGYRVVLVQPRRMATKLVATWMAQELGEAVGRRVGYQMRFESYISRETELLVLTEGLLIKKLLDTSFLEQFSVFILDEFHERHIHADISFAAICKLMETNPRVKLIIMSATLDSTSIERFLQNVTLFDIPGKNYPVTTEYHPPTDSDHWHSYVARKVVALRDDHRCKGHILTFLTGIRDILRVKSELIGKVPASDILLLTSDSAEEFWRQFSEDSSFQNHSQSQKIILATNVAETSITIPGVTGVIDGGLAKISGFSHWNGLPSLQVQKISKAAADQRSGRAGRTSPGVCYRLYSEYDFSLRKPYDVPEIRRSDLAHALLEIEAMKRSLKLGKWTWFEKPQESQLSSSHQLLVALGAIDGKGMLTNEGQQMALWPFHPRLGRMILEGEKLGIPGLSLLAAILISEDFESTHNGKKINSRRGASDVWGMVHEYLMDYKTNATHFKIQLIARIYNDLRRSSKSSFSLENLVKTYLENSKEIDEENTDAVKLRRCLFYAFGDRVAKLRSSEKNLKTGLETFIYHFSYGNQGSTANFSAVSGAEWIIAIDVKEIDIGHKVQSTQKLIVKASKIEREWLALDPFSLLREEKKFSIDPKAKRPVSVKRTFYQDLLIDETSSLIDSDDEPSDVSIADVLLKEVRTGWNRLYEDQSELKIYHKKLDILSDLKIEHKLPRIEGELLEIFQSLIVDDCKNWNDVQQKDIRQSIRDLLNVEDQKFLDDYFPFNVKLASGKILNIHYCPDQEPYVEGKVQDFYGQKIHPTICKGKYSLTTKLLAPNLRPAQITKDLPSFWGSSYELVKKELKARYPRHNWADDPTKIQPALKKHIK